MSTRTTTKGLLAVGLIGGTLALIHPASALAQHANPDPWVTSSQVSAMVENDNLPNVLPDVSPDSLNPSDMVRGVEPVATPTVEDPTVATPLSQTEPPTAPSPVSLPGEREPDVLPFAKNELPTTYPSVGVGLGVGSYRADLGRVKQAFHTMEGVYRTAGYSIPNAREIHLDAMALWKLAVRLNKAWDVALQLGRSNGESNQLRTTGVLVSRRFASTAGGGFSLVAGLGGGTYGFSFMQSYGVTVSPVDANGGYYVLDKIVLKGGGNYWTGTGGFKFRPGMHTAVDVLAQYVGMNDASANTERAGRISMNLSGVMVGASLTLFL